jgi:hypothetical protein
MSNPVWDFRIIRRRISGRDFFQVHRVFYADNLKTKAILIENRPATIIGDDAKVMLGDVDKILDSFDNPVIHIPEWNRDDKR